MAETGKTGPGGREPAASADIEAFQGTEDFERRRPCQRKFPPRRCGSKKNQKKKKRNPTVFLGFQTKTNEKPPFIWGLHFLPFAKLISCFVGGKKIFGILDSQPCDVSLASQVFECRFCALLVGHRYPALVTW